MISSGMLQIILNCTWRTLNSACARTGHWKGDDPLTPNRFKGMLAEAVNKLDVNQPRREVEPFVKNPENLSIWSREFFLDVASRVKIG